MAAIKRTDAFDIVQSKTSRWSLVLDADQTVALYATYSNVNARADRETVLAELGRIARNKFGGRIVRNMTTSLYIARRGKLKAALPRSAWMAASGRFETPAGRPGRSTVTAYAG
jgi:hypothetical protein